MYGIGFVFDAGSGVSPVWSARHGQRVQKAAQRLLDKAAALKDTGVDKVYCVAVSTPSELENGSAVRCPAAKPAAALSRWRMRARRL